MKWKVWVFVRKKEAARQTEGDNVGSVFSWHMNVPKTCYKAGLTVRLDLPIAEHAFGKTSWLLNSRCCVDACVGQKYEQTGVSPLFDQQVIKNIRGSKNASYSKLHQESAFLDLFRGCWTLKGEEENQLLQLMADVTKPIYSGGVSNGKEGEGTMGRGTWPHLCSPKYHSARNAVPCLSPSAWSSQLAGPTRVSSHAHVIAPSWERSCLHRFNKSGFLSLQLFILWKAKCSVLWWLLGNGWTQADKMKEKTGPCNL